MITIIMAAYNGQEYINEQLESIKNQTYRDWRLVVRDDGSSDKTVDILRKFAEEVEQEVIIKINEEPSGILKVFYRMRKMTPMLCLQIRMIYGKKIK